MQDQWWKESVVYQIYPRSFKDSDGDGIGDIQGITEKLDYLQYLGVDVLWLSPVYQSPNDDNGYDISDYQAIMPEFGTMKDFDNLLQQAHKRNIKIIMDLVVNHTSDEHAWFQNSRKKEKNRYQDYYIWEKEKPNNWESYFGGPAWEFDEEREMYYLHLFSKKQPDLNWKNPELREEIYKMMTWWLDKGIDGFRMDVINLISKVDGFPDGNPIEGTPYTEKAPYVICGPEMHSYLKEMHSRVLSRYNIMTVGEGLGLGLEEARKITAEDSKELNMMFTFEHMEVENIGKEKWTDQRFKLTDLKRIMTKWQKGLEHEGWNSLYWNNHDQPRVVSRFGDPGFYWEKSAKMLGVCLHMMKGTPYIYQGEEIGMTNIELNTIDEYRDIESKAAYERYKNYMGYSEEKIMKCIHARSRDNARSPMQWNGERHAGFTNGIPWFIVNSNYGKINAESQLHDPDSIFCFYRKLIELRKMYEIIVEGDYNLLYPEDDDLYIYTRELKNEEMLVICNFSRKQIEFEVPSKFSNKNNRLLISNVSRRTLEKKMSLSPYEADVFLFTK